MVCKEDVLSWFKDLDSYKRIDVIYDLLNMCLPFELRFLGSCVEEIGKHTYQELRGPALFANDFEKLSKDTSLNSSLVDDSVRHRILLYLSLLSSRNYSVANWLYKNYLRTECVEESLFKANVKSDILLGEFLLLYTMALYHPAFTFEHKLFLGNMLSRLTEFKESKNRFSPKPSTYGYPPGFGFPFRTASNTETTSSGPGKANMINSYGDVKVQLSSLHQMVPPQQPTDYITTIWNRPGIHCGAPEVPPFPPQPSISPLVSQASTPTHSRSTSPHRTTSVNHRLPMNTRPPSSIPPSDLVPPLSGTVPPAKITQTVPIDPSVSLSSLPPMFANMNELNSNDDELTPLAETNLVDTPWISSRSVIPDNMKPPNGVCYPPQYHKIPHPYLIEQIQALNLEGENSLYNSNSSSSSSLNQSPPETPTLVPPQSADRVGPDKSRVANGVPQPTTFINNLPPPPPPLCDTTPPPPAAFNNCTVPYSYPASFNQLPPNSPQYPTRHQPVGCYNCGAAGHTGNDCLAQNIEEITQKRTYSLDYNNVIRDAENK